MKFEENKKSINLVSKFMESLDEDMIEENSSSLTDKELDAVVNIIDFFCDYHKMSPSDFVSDCYTVGEIFDNESVSHLDYKGMLKFLARRINKYLKETDQEDIFYPFTERDFYEIDDQSGVFNLPY